MERTKMKLTKETLKQIIKEELDAVLAEEAVEEGMSQYDEKFQAALERAKKEMPNATEEEHESRAIDLMRGAQ
jgi:hypothetical protein